MSNEEIRKLLGGYATGTLTPSEQKVLLEAALHDPELFEAIVEEQGVRDMLDDPSNRAELLQALDGKPTRSWFWRWAAAGGALGVAALVATNMLLTSPQPHVPAARIAEQPTVSLPAPDVARQTPAQSQTTVAVPAREKTFQGPSSRPKEPVTLALRESEAKPQIAAAPTPPAGLTSAAPPQAEESTQLQARVASQTVNVQAADLSFRAEQNGINLQATVLRRGSDGAFRASPAITTFRAGESIRLQLTSNADANVTVLGHVGTTLQPVFTGRIAHDVPTIVPLQLEAKNTTYSVILGASAPLATRAMLADQVEQAKAENRATGGVVGGVVGGVPGGLGMSAVRMAPKAASARKAKSSSEAKESEPTAQTLDTAGAPPPPAPAAAPVPLKLDVILRVE